MAEDFIEELYKKTSVVYTVKTIIQDCRRTLYRKCDIKWKESQESFALFCRDVSEFDEATGECIWNELVKVSKKLSEKKYREVADTLENIVPLLYEAIAQFGMIDVSDNEYRLFSSKSGFLAIESVSTGELLTSGNDPAWEAHEKANNIFKPYTKEFHTLGCELGYLCWQMFEASNESVEIYVYENDRKIIDYALKYGVLERIPENKLHIIIDNTDNLIKKFENSIEKYKDDEAVYNIEIEALERLGKENIYKLTDLYISINSTNEFYDISELNFYRNIYNVGNYVSEIEIKDDKSDWIVVGGGPSLDENIEYLRDNQREKYIIVATTVYKKLIQLGVKPDFVVVVDPQNRTFEHIKDIKEENSKLIILDTANWKFGEFYKGDKYLIPTGQGFFNRILHESNNMRLWTPYGTVSSMCIDLAVKLGAKNIELIGVDLSYPNGNTHATGTMDYNKINSIDGLSKIRSVSGDYVYTSEVFKTYIAEIENLIKSNPSVVFYNRSSRGALINGCLSMK